MGWNGLDLVNDFASELGDTSAGFKTKVLRWINEGLRDIATSHTWPQLREKGMAVLTVDVDIHSVVLPKPIAPTVALLAGGSLALLTEYKVLVTFYESQSGVESIAGISSAGITPLGTDLSITVAAIPVSTNPLVTSRKIYVSVAGAAYQYYSEISDNTTLTTTITAPPSSPITPPDENSIHMLDGDVFIEDERVLDGTTVQNINYISGARNVSGTPVKWAPMNEEEIMVYPRPSVATSASFYYFKRPARIFGLVNSIPQFPSWIFEDLRRYVIWRGYDFRDRAGKESKKQNYDDGLRLSISRRGKPLKRAGRIRSVVPDSDGYVS